MLQTNVSFWENKYKFFSENVLADFDLLRSNRETQILEFRQKLKFHITFYLVLNIFNYIEVN